MKTSEIEEHFSELSIFVTNYDPTKTVLAPIWASSAYFKIELITWTDGVRWIDFYFGNSLYASYKLEELDFLTLHKELEKILDKQPEFQSWSNNNFIKCGRENKLNTLGI